MRYECKNCDKRFNTADDTAPQDVNCPNYGGRHETLPHPPRKITIQVTAVQCPVTFIAGGFL